MTSFIKKTGLLIIMAITTTHIMAQKKIVQTAHSLTHILNKDKNEKS